MLRKLSEGQRRTIAHWTMEFAVVVVGVLLALWLQGWSERRDQHEDLRAAENAIHDEIDQALDSLAQRRVVDRCLSDRARLLHDRLVKGGDNWLAITDNSIAVDVGKLDLHGIAGAYSTIDTNFSMAEWQSALTTGVLKPMKPNRFAQLVAIYSEIEQMRDAKAKEEEAEKTLSSLASPIRLTPQIRNQMLQAIWQADHSRRVFAAFIGPRDIISEVKALGWDDKKRFDQLAETTNRSTRQLGVLFRPCARPYTNPFRTSPA